MMDKSTVIHMVERFLAWPLPNDFNPDAGISFDDSGKPTGTNLLTATQAEEMVLHMLEVAPNAPAEGELAKLVMELAEAVDNAAEDVGGSRSQLIILREAVQVAERMARNTPSPEPECSELLPCPFCGGEPVLSHIEPHTHHYATFLPDCKGSVTIECNCVGVIAETEEESKRIWNRRAPASGECEWCQNGDGYWDTGCSNAFEFIADGPEENKFSYCPYCSRKVRVKAQQEGGE